jgi:hypothetical protein
VDGFSTNCTRYLPWGLDLVEAKVQVTVREGEVTTELSGGLVMVQVTTPHWMSKLVWWLAAKLDPSALVTSTLARRADPVVSVGRLSSDGQSEIT